MSQPDLIQIDNPPEGWTTDPEELEFDEEWAGDNSEGQQLCQSLGIGKGRPVLCNDKWDELLFEAGGKFYLWYRISDSVAEIVSPADLNGILDVLGSTGPKGLKTSNHV